MALITWTWKLETGIAAVDAEHKKWVVLINELHDALSAGKAGQVLDSVLEGVANYGRTHFKHEEALMAKHKFPKLDEHKALHARFLAEIDKLSGVESKGKLSVSLSTMSMMRTWLIEHIEEADQVYAAFIRENS